MTLVMFQTRLRPPRTNDVVLIDVDGTLANNEHRQHHMAGAQKDWKQFFDEQHLDTVHPEIALIARALWQQGEVFVMIGTGRPARFADELKGWLSDCDIPHHRLIMRGMGDNRADAIVKREMLDHLRALDYNVVLAIDDRPEVVKMWRANGVKCLQADPTAWEQQPLTKIADPDPIEWVREQVHIVAAHPMMRVVLDTLERTAPQPTKVSTRQVLRLFREFAIKNATQWEMGANHHHPIWELVAEACNDRSDITSGPFYKFLQAQNRATLQQLIDNDPGEPPHPVFDANEEDETCGWGPLEDGRYGCLRCDESSHLESHTPRACIRRKEKLASIAKARGDE